MRLRNVVIAVVLLCIGAICGCDCGDKSASKDAKDMNKALAGGPVSKAGQLEGSWYKLTDGIFLGFEFMKEGKVLVTGPGGIVQTHSYSVLDGGRVSFVLGGAATMVYDATIDGDVLELRGQGGFGAPEKQRFRKLKSGETVVAAYKAEEEAEKKSFDDRVAALDALLKRKDLVLAATEAGGPAAIAVELEFSAPGSFQGKAWYDEKPPRLDAVSGNTVAEKFGQTTRVRFNFGQRGGSFSLDATGEPKDLKVSGKVTMGGAGKTYEIVLKSDPTRHAEIVKRFEAEGARVESMKGPVLNVLKDYAVLKGQLQPQNPQQKELDTVQITFVKDAKSGAFRGEGVITNGQTGRGEILQGLVAGAIVANEKPLLRIVSPAAKEFTLTVADAATGKLSGQWNPPGYPQGKAANLTITQALDAAARDKQFADQRDSLKKMTGEKAYIGVGFEGSGLGLQIPLPVRLTLTAAGNGSFTGKVSVPMMQSTLTAAGTVQESPSGPRLLVRFPTVETASNGNSKIFAPYMQKEAWVLAPGEGGKLTGYLMNANNARPITLDPATDERRTRVRKKLTETLAKNPNFNLVRPVTQGYEATVLGLKIDESAKTVAIDYVSGGYIMNAKKGVSVLEGTLKDQDGWDVIEITNKTPRAPAVKVYPLAVVEMSEGGPINLLGIVAQQKPDGTLAGPENMPGQYLQFAPAEK